MTPFEQEILAKLCRVIDGVITHQDFLKWFVPITWDVPKEETRANKLIYAIKLRYAEYTNGHWTKEELRERLIDLIL